MRRIYLFLLFLNSIYFTVHSITITVENPSEGEIQDYTIEIPVENLSLSYGNYIVIAENGEKLPLEVITDLRGNQKAIFSVDHLGRKQKRVFKLQKGSADKYPKRTYAELAHKIGGKFDGNRYEGGFSWVKSNHLTVDSSFRDHAYYIKYEGPGWESDMVGFRFYLDQRNGIDVFGKKTPDIVLPFVGVDGYDSYHQMDYWGMDNMKVGKTLGLGSIATWNGDKAERVEKRDSVTCIIPVDGKIRSQVKTTFYGWDADGTKCNLESLISIDAGNRASHMELYVDETLDNIATGIIKSKSPLQLQITKQEEGAEWSYIATFGKQGLNDDMMGLAIFFRNAQLKTITEDELNHVLILNPIEGYVEYYFMPTWEHDWQPVKNEKEFQECVDKMLHKLNQPVLIEIS